MREKKDPGELSQYDQGRSGGRQNISLKVLKWKYIVQKVELRCNRIHQQVVTE